MIYLTEMYQYVFTSFLAQTTELPQAIKQKFSAVLTGEHSAEFRQVLRELGANDLEQILYGNTTDKIKETEKKIFPADDKIKKEFKYFSEIYKYFKLPNFYDIAESEFIQFFKICKIYGDFIEENNNEPNNYNAYEHAYKMTVIFGGGKINNKFENFDDYVKRFVTTKHFIHDALYRELPVNDNAAFNMLPWRKFIREEGPAAMIVWQNAAEIQQVLQRDPHNLAEARNIVSRLQYERADEYPELNKLAKKENLREKYFNTALEIEKNKKKYDNLPNAMISHHDQKNNADYHLVKLPITDPRAYLLGFYSNSCQSVGNNGEQCVRDGQILENNGFYVLVKSTTEHPPATPFTNDNKIDYTNFEIVGQGYAWLSEHGNLTFDSWENKFPASDDAIVVPMLKDFAIAVTHTPADIVRVTLGTGGQSPVALLDEIVNNPERMLQGKQYGDSLQQLLIYENKEKKAQITAALADIVNELTTRGLPIEALRFFKVAGLNDSYFYLKRFQAVLADENKYQALRQLLLSLSNAQLDFVATHWDIIFLLIEKVMEKNISQVQMQNILPLITSSSLADKYYNTFVALNNSQLLNDDIMQILIAHKRFSGFPGGKVKEYITLIKGPILAPKQILNIFEYSDFSPPLTRVLSQLKESDNPAYLELLELIDVKPQLVSSIVQALSTLDDNDLGGVPYNSLVIKMGMDTWSRGTEEEILEFVTWGLTRVGPVKCAQSAVNGLLLLKKDNLLNPEIMAFIAKLAGKYCYAVCAIIVDLKKADKLDQAALDLLEKHSKNILPAQDNVHLLLQNGSLTIDNFKDVLENSSKYFDMFYELKKDGLLTPALFTSLQAMNDAERESVVKFSIFSASKSKATDEPKNSKDMQPTDLAP